MEAVLLANVASTLSMVGLAWFVDVVHYPLFAAVGRGLCGLPRALVAVPAHRALGEGFIAEGLDRLRRADLIRAATWTLHGAVVIALLATLI